MVPYRSRKDVRQGYAKDAGGMREAHVTAQPTRAIERLCICWTLQKDAAVIHGYAMDTVYCCRTNCSFGCLNTGAIRGEF